MDYTGLWGLVKGELLTGIVTLVQVTAPLVGVIIAVQFGLKWLKRFAGPDDDEYYSSFGFTVDEDGVAWGPEPPDPDEVWLEAGWIHDDDGLLWSPDWGRDAEEVQYERGLVSGEEEDYAVESMGDE